MEQWSNLKEYFLVFLPKQNNLRNDIETTHRSQTIRKYLLSKVSILYMSFGVYVAGLLEDFLMLFQSSKKVEK